MLNSSCHDPQLLKPFYRTLSIRKIWWGLGPQGGSFGCRVLQQDLDGDRDRRRVLVHFSTTAKSAAACKVCLTVNGVLLTGVSLKTINVTSYVKATYNGFLISGSDIPEDLLVRVLVVERTEESALLGSLASGGHDAPPVRAALDDKENEDAIVERVMVSLDCPLKRARLVVPCRGADCLHAQCFDALTYLRLNEATMRPLWQCPVCSGDVDVQSLCVDPFMLQVLRLAPKSCDTVRLLGEGQWTAVNKDALVWIEIEDSPVRPLRPANRKLDISVIDLTDSFAEDAQS